MAAGPRSRNAREASRTAEWEGLNRQITACQACPRLTAYTAAVAREKRKAFRDETYWGRPVPNFGNAPARLLIVGLAPAAHGANRTGRMFTGDRSGEWLYAALHRAGFANQPHATDPNDGLELGDCVITSACHCAPPDNKPARDELLTCRTWLARTVDLVAPKVYLALGKIGWDALLPLLRERGDLPKGRAVFAHGAEIALSNNRWLLGSYHPSQQNTFTGRLTHAMLDDVFAQVRRRISA